APAIFQQAPKPCPCYKTRLRQFFSKLQSRALVTKPGSGNFSASSKAVPLLQNPAPAIFQQAPKPCPCYKTRLRQFFSKLQSRALVTKPGSGNFSASSKAVPLLQNPAPAIFRQAPKPCPCYKTRLRQFFGKLQSRALVTKPGS